MIRNLIVSKNLKCAWWDPGIPEGDGSWAKPYYWDAICDETRMNVLNMNNEGSSDGNGRIFVKILCKAGVNYSIGENASFDGKVYGYKPDATGVDNTFTTGDDNSTNINGNSITDYINFTAEVDGLYTVGFGAYSSGRGNLSFHMNVAPEIVQGTPGPAWDSKKVSRKGDDILGAMIRHQDLKEAKLLWSDFPDESTPTNMTSNENEIWKITSSGVYENDVQPYNAFTGIPPTNNMGFHTNGSQPFWICWQHKIKPVLIKKINITPYFYNDAWTSSLSSLRLEGSNDGTNWTEIAVLTGSYGNKVTVTHLLPENEIGYFYHRLYSLSPSSYMTVGNIAAYSKVE